MSVLRVAGATVSQTPLDWKGNVKNIIEAIHDAKSQQAELLCFPELTITAYGCEDLFLSKWVSEKSLQCLERLVPETQGITVGLGFPMLVEGHIYNCFAVISDARVLGITAKQFMAIDGVHYEFRWFTPWPSSKVIDFDFLGQKVPLGDVVYQLKGVSFALEICEDAWREDRPAKRHLARGVDMILNPSASHFALEKTHLRRELVTASSKKFKCAYVYVNMLGNEAGRIIFDGELLFAAKGEILADNVQLSFKSYNLAWADFNTQTKTFEGISGRFKTLSREEEFARSVSLALFDYLRKSRSRGFVLSLSGGADSSTCAVLVAEMVRRGSEELGMPTFLQKLGRSELWSEIENLPDDLQRKNIVSHLLICAYQGTMNSSEATLRAAKEIASGIGATFHYWNVDAEVQGYTNKIEKALGRQLKWKSDDIALQNIQSRARSPVIWLLANVKNMILLTTSNRSEADTGYATMDGDTSGSLAPIAAIDKPFIRKWLKWAQQNLGYNCLGVVNSLTPTAELRPPDQSQTDEADLMPYDLLLRIEQLAIRDRLSPVEIYGNLKGQDENANGELKANIHTFFSLWSKNQWKRERTAPAFHLDDFNVDPKTWCRFPIISGAFRDELEDLDAV